MKPIVPVTDLILDILTHASITPVHTSDIRVILEYRGINMKTCKLLKVLAEMKSEGKIQKVKLEKSGYAWKISP